MYLISNSLENVYPYLVALPAFSLYLFEFAPLGLLQDPDLALVLSHGQQTLVRSD